MDWVSDIHLAAACRPVSEPAIVIDTSSLGGQMSAVVVRPQNFSLCGLWQSGTALVVGFGFLRSGGRLDPGDARYGATAR